ncbi:hypothetical protein BH23THE1_BH23THE1_25970 [soil metagenome]
MFAYILPLHCTAVESISPSYGRVILTTKYIFKREPVDILAIKRCVCYSVGVKVRQMKRYY